MTVPVVRVSCCSHEARVRRETRSIGADYRDKKIFIVHVYGAPVPYLWREISTDAYPLRENVILNDERTCDVERDRFLVSKNNNFPRRFVISLYEKVR